MMDSYAYTSLDSDTNDIDWMKIGTQCDHDEIYIDLDLSDYFPCEEEPSRWSE